MGGVDPGQSEGLIRVHSVVADVSIHLQVKRIHKKSKKTNKIKSTVAVYIIIDDLDTDYDDQSKTPPTLL